ncbi:hypothetical protein E3U43_002457 [Larimichthys crocea]|uniref:Uncharacterized protein n=1 Tax=Larimichthys crocea TaxID=215358 RepID=A0ACD3QRM9_LARCR|nr:hypothetical protein E3U43_002457 [Larimichthys crocea]
MSSRKRRRNYKDIKCVFFPDEVENKFQKVNREPPSLSSVSSAKSWERTSSHQERKLSAIRNLALSALESAGHSNEDPVNIAWSSSDSEQSDDETRQRHASKVVAQQQQQQRPQRPGRPTAPIQSYTTALRMLSTDKEELPVIDTDSDLDGSEEGFVIDSGQQISECESESLDGKQELPLQLTNERGLEISGSGSDVVNDGHVMTSSTLDSECFPLQTELIMKGTPGAVMWVLNVIAIFEPPPFKSDRWLSVFFETNNFAHTFCSSRTPDKPGVLVLEVLEVQEECSMQLAHCEHHGPPGEGHRHNNPVSEKRVRMLVLFNRETASQLIPCALEISSTYIHHGKVSP